MFTQLSSQFFLSPAQRRLFEQGLPILTYHSIADPPRGARDPFLYVNLPRFEEQLSSLVRYGFISGTLDDVPRADANLEKKVVISFDDGYCNVLDHALAILTRHQFSSIQFIVADLIGKHNEWDVLHGDAPEPLMDAAQIREWLRAGQQIGSHSLTHRNLAKLSSADAREQIFASKKKLEDLFGVPINHFCYPHGKWTPSVRDLVQEAGYATACTTEFGVNTSQTSPFQLNRVFVLSQSEMVKKAAHRLGRKIRGQ